MKAGQLREVVLVGGGHSHVQVLEQFATQSPPGSRLTLVVDTPIAVYSGMVPGFVAGQYRQQELEIDVGRLAGLAGARLVISKAVGVDAQERQILLEDGASVSYDIASFDIGSRLAGHDLPGVSQYSATTRPIGRFIEQVDQIIRKARDHDPATPFRVVVVGAGAGGIELAFTLQQRLQEETSTSVQILILQNQTDILGGYADSLVRRVYRRSRERGIQIECNRKVAAVEPEAVVLAEGERISCQAVVWVTGPASHSIFTESGLPTDRLGFVRVRSTLQVEEHDELFATGDCAALIEHPQTPKAGVYAVRQGPCITHNIRALIVGGPLRIYRPQHDFLTLLNLGDGKALGTKWGRSVEGRWVMKLKDWIDRRFMRRFQEPL